MLSAEEGTAVVVTTKHRGLFFGYIKDKSNLPESIELTRCRNCVYWSKQLYGFIGLATDGPNGQCRVGPAAPFIEIFDVTSVITATQEAVAKWESAPWRS